MATQTTQVRCAKCGKLKPAPAPRRVAAATVTPVRARAVPVPATAPPPPDLLAAIRASRKGGK
jgi:hypothetical protein